MLELVIAVAVLAMASYYAYTEIRATAYTHAVKNIVSFTDNIVDVGIFDQKRGYLSGKNANCSQTMDYRDISARRIKDCSGIKKFWWHGAGDVTDGTKYYFVVGSVDGECRLYVDDDPADPLTVALFLDCSASSLPAAKKQFLEEMFVGHFQRYYDSMFVGSNYRATCSKEDGCGNTGSLTDGRVKVVLRN